MFIWEFINKAEGMCLFPWFQEKYSIITGWIELWEAAALLLFLHLLQSVGAEILKATDRCFTCFTGGCLAAWVWEMLPMAPMWLTGWTNHSTDAAL